MKNIKHILAIVLIAQQILWGFPLDIINDTQAASEPLQSIISPEISKEGFISPERIGGKVKTLQKKPKKTQYEPLLKLRTLNITST
ncbi:MAG: hypothetical protein HYS08_00660, partial [Chlamydiae bacterium]|nr:hypothetical protein [Chlamydiota bacterium]